jgi:hypothetical protein
MVPKYLAKKVGAVRTWIKYDFENGGLPVL